MDRSVPDRVLFDAIQRLYTVRLINNVISRILTEIRKTNDNVFTFYRCERCQKRPSEIRTKY